MLLCAQSLLCLLGPVFTSTWTFFLSSVFVNEWLLERLLTETAVGLRLASSSEFANDNSKSGFLSNRVPLARVLRTKGGARESDFRTFTRMLMLKYNS